MRSKVRVKKIERTVEQYAELLQRSWWKYRQTWYPQSNLLGVIEALKTQKRTLQR